MLHLPGVAIAAGVVPFAIKSVARLFEVKILRHHSRINIDRSVSVRAGNIERVVVHDIVEINPDAEAMRGFHHAKQIALGAVSGADRVTLIFASEIEAIPKIVADGQSATAFGGRRHPKRIVTSLGQFRHFVGDFTPTRIKIGSCQL